jgi:Holliday junction resolvase RusA-like endonuclease
MTEPLCLVLPSPPSVNAMFANVPGRGRVKTKAYKAWRTAAGWELIAQLAQRRLNGHRPLFPGRVTLLIDLQRGRGDASNRLKAAEDLLVTHHIIEDDRFVERCSIGWSDTVKGMQIVVSPVSS